jgi:siroheme synthase-like protein
MNCGLAKSYYKNKSTILVGLPIFTSLEFCGLKKVKMKAKTSALKGRSEKKITGYENQLYPVFLKLSQVKVLLVGGGNVAFEKLQSLLLNSPNAEITVVAPLILPKVKNFIAAYSNCEIINRAFEKSDLDNKRIVICATDDGKLHEQIKALAYKKGILINVADTPDLCDFYLGSIVQKGSLKIAVSTNGKSPTIAKRIKEFLEEMIPGEMEEVLNNLQAIRKKMSGDFKEKVRKLDAITKELAKHDNE